MAMVWPEEQFRLPNSSMNKSPALLHLTLCAPSQVRALLPFMQSVSQFCGGNTDILLSADAFAAVSNIVRKNRMEIFLIIFVPQRRCILVCYLPLSELALRCSRLLRRLEPGRRLLAGTGYLCCHPTLLRYFHILRRLCLCMEMMAGRTRFQLVRGARR